MRRTSSTRSKRRSRRSEERSESSVDSAQPTKAREWRAVVCSGAPRVLMSLLQSSGTNERHWLYSILLLRLLLVCHCRVFYFTNSVMSRLSATELDNILCQTLFHSPCCSLLPILNQVHNSCSPPTGARGRVAGGTGLLGYILGSETHAYLYRSTLGAKHRSMLQLNQ